MNIAWFKDISKKDIPSVGGKGANLGEMFSRFPIPNGFCITVDAYKSFLEHNKIEADIFMMLRKLDTNDTKELDETSEKIRKLITRSKIPKKVEEDILKAYKKLNGFVAVRSSATAEDLPTASFAGQQATYLNVKEKDLLKAVKDCWASLFTSRAIYYRTVNNFEHEKVLISVVVQKMIDSKKAGVMFTVNPVNKNHNEMIIEGSYGLGEMVVSGKVTPDTYTVRKDSDIIDAVIGSKRIQMKKDSKGNNIEEEVPEEFQEIQCLTEDEISSIAKLGAEIEKHYGSPQDIEWAIDDKVYILQSRPITTL